MEVIEYCKPLQSMLVFSVEIFPEILIFIQSSVFDTLILFTYDARCSAQNWPTYQQIFPSAVINEAAKTGSTLICCLTTLFYCSVHVCVNSDAY